MTRWNGTSFGAVQAPRWLTLRKGGDFFVLIDGGFADDAVDDFVARTGFTTWQYVTELLTVVTFHFGQTAAGFQGRCWNNTFPLVDEDCWTEAEAGGDEVRAWRRDDSGYLFTPYTLADLRTVTRCGAPEVFVESPATRFSARISMGRDGISFLSAPAEVERYVLDLLASQPTPVVRDFTDLAEFISEDGTLIF